MNKTLVEIIDNWDTALCTLSVLQQLASRIAFGIEVDSNTRLAKTELEELWVLLDELKAKTDFIRSDMQTTMKSIG